MKVLDVRKAMRPDGSSGWMDFEGTCRTVSRMYMMLLRIPSTKGEVPQNGK